MKQIPLLLLLFHLQFIGCQLPDSPKQASAPTTNSQKKISKATKIPPIQRDFKDHMQALKKTEHYQFIGVKKTVQPFALDSLATQMEQTHREIEIFVGQESTLPPIKCYLYPTAEAKGLLLNNTRQSHIDFKQNQVHIVFNKAYAGNVLQLENQLLFRHLLGQSVPPILEEGLGIAFAPKWQKHGCNYWTSKLHISNNLPPLSFLLKNKNLDRESYLLKGAMAGSLSTFLLQYWGRKTFLQRYKEGNIGGEEILQLETNWKDFLNEISLKYKAKIQAHQKTISSRKKLPYFKGFNFAHEGYQIYDGYMSQQAKAALEAMERIGVNTSAIVPYSGMRSSNALQAKDIRVSRRAGVENDESVIHAAYQSKKLGMVTVLKPQVWVWNSWPGDIDFKTEVEWTVFFERYERWILHYAMLAEIHEFDVFCLGVEFVKATLEHPERWQKMIHRMGAFYSGSLTYAANWGAEFEESSLWANEELDFIGINCYYPLSKEEKPTDRQLQKGFETILEKIEQIAKQYNKKVIFTEIGFRSIKKPWQNPHHYDWNDEPNYDEEDQKRCYAAVLAALEGNEDWCQGILWWKWPSYLSHSQESKTEFAPNGKMAEEVVKKWFKD